MNGKEQKEILTALTGELEEMINRWSFLAEGLAWADFTHVRKLIDRLVAAQPALDEGTARDATTIAQKLHNLYGEADKLAFAIEEQAAGLERLLKRIQEVG